MYITFGFLLRKNPQKSKVIRITFWNLQNFLKSMEILKISRPSAGFSLFSKSYTYNFSKVIYVLYI